MQLSQFIVVSFYLDWFDEHALGGFPQVQFAGRRVAANFPLSMNGATVRVTSHMEISEGKKREYCSGR